jgi:hypothetical protein
MSLQELVPPLLGFTLLAIGLALCTFLFITLKQDILRMHRFNKQQRELLEKTIRELGGQIGVVKLALKDVERKAGEHPQLSPPKPGMNASRRTQVLRMYRRGERPEQIAAALSLPQNEVDLLLKVSEQAANRG